MNQGNEIVPSTGQVSNSAAFINNFLDHDGRVKESVIRGGHYQDLRIPRKPEWDAKMTAREIA